MSFSVGIVGLPNVGKSTLFKALTKQPIDISNYPFCTIDPNVGIVEVPDERLSQINDLIPHDKVTPAAIEFVDIAGLVKEAHKGEGLGNQFLANVREVKVICHVVRNFEDDNITHVEGKPDPQRDAEIINTELIMKDLDTVENRLEKVQKEARSGAKPALAELESLNQIKEILNQGHILSQQPEKEKERFAETSQIFNSLLTCKPMIYVLNTQQDDLEKELPLKPALAMDLKLEMEMAELSEDELKELNLGPSGLNDLIKECYEILDLITFLTAGGGKEARAWPLKKGSTAPQAGSVIHTDFEEKFIKADVINWQKLIEAGSWAKAREKGVLQTVGKDYIVVDGDVIEFKI